MVQLALEAAADRLSRESAQAATGNQVSDEVTPAQRRADALGMLAECALNADFDRGSAGDRYQVSCMSMRWPYSRRAKKRSRHRSHLRRARQSLN